MIKDESDGIDEHRFDGATDGTIRICVWNMHQRSDIKKIERGWQYMRENGVDVAVVQEASEVGSQFAAFARPRHNTRVTGVGIVNLSGRIELADATCHCDGDAVSVTVPSLGGLRLVSVHAAIGNRPKGYIGHGGHDGVMLQRLEELESVLVAGPRVLLGGDFNTDLRMPSLRNPKRVFEKLNRYRLMNLICEPACALDEEIGCRMNGHRPTRRDAANRVDWTIDHVYGSKQIRSIMPRAWVGSSDIWESKLSDHLPLFLDLTL